MRYLWSNDFAICIHGQSRGGGGGVSCFSGPDQCDIFFYFIIRDLENMSQQVTVWTISFLQPTF
jgi:hypothetical protein